MEITQKYVVDGQIFDTVEEAEQYVSENKDKQRVDAFIKHLREKGAKRIPGTTVETVEEFIRFESGYYNNHKEETTDAVEHQDTTPEPEPEPENTSQDDESPPFEEEKEPEEVNSGSNVSSIFPSDDKEQEETTVDSTPATTPGKSLFGS